MKFSINLSLTLFISSALSIMMLLSSCNNNSDTTCDGYTGKITEARADSLVKRCHFISKDSIERWVGRYEAYQKELVRRQAYRTTANDTANAKTDEMKATMDNMSARFLMSGSVSYNSCIIKKILCNKNSIGLRVLYGIDNDNKMHIILVGIQPDYTNLYIDDAEDCCDKSLNKTLGAGATGANGNPGGAEYGQLP